MTSFAIFCLKCFIDNTDYLNIEVEIVYDVEEGRDTSLEFLKCRCKNCDTTQTIPIEKLNK